MSLTAAHVAALRCAVCSQALTLEGQRLRCGAGHSSDLARQGYVHLSGLDVSHAGDTAPMLDARGRVQSAGLHSAVTAAIDRAVGPELDGMLVEIGAGTGHHLAALLEGHPAALGLALDSSRYAARRAARIHDRVGSIVADAAHPLPIRDSAASVVLSVFAPRPAAEIRRVVAPGGHVVIAHALPGHLEPLVTALGLLQVGDDKASQIDAALDLTLVGEEVVQSAITADADTIADLVLMGPNAFHQDPTGLRDRIAALDLPVAATLHVRVATYRTG